MNAKTGLYLAAALVIVGCVLLFSPRVEKDVSPKTVNTNPSSTTLPSHRSDKSSNRGKAGRNNITDSITDAVTLPEICHLEARDALSDVGTDQKAEECWVAAINNPELTPNQRRNLIEDLNEDGFPDPKNITEIDLPLIRSRMALIEKLAPSAMDEVNAEAFAEAYKDLAKMLIRLTE